MFKLFKRMCKQIMNVTCKTVEKLFKDEDLRKIFGGGCIGVGVLCLKDCFKNTKGNKIALGSGLFVTLVLSGLLNENN